MTKARQPARTVTEMVIRQIRTEIQSGKLMPGERLRQSETAARLGASTTPVREAFAALEREGLLINSPHRGVVVFQPSLDDLYETYEIRIPLEALAATKAVPNMTPADLAEIKKHLDAMEVDVTPRRYSSLNMSFHAAIYRCAQRPQLEKLIEQLRDSSMAYVRLYANFHPSPTDTRADHHAIYDACARGDADGAGEATARHLRNTVDIVSNGLRSSGAL